MEKVKELWIPYIKNLDEKIQDLIISAIDVSLLFFIAETGDKPPITPLFEISLELHEPNIVYVPSADIEDPANLLVYVEGLMQDVYNMGSYVKRIDMEATETYQDVAKDAVNIQSKSNEFVTRVANGMEKASEFVKEFEE